MHGPKIYPKARENPKAFSYISSPIFLESSIQCPWGVELFYPLPFEKDLTSNPKVFETLGFFTQHL